MRGNEGDDDVVGGSFTPASGATGQPDTGDTLIGDAGEDVVLGDNGSLTRPTAATATPLTAGRVITQRAVSPYDLGTGPTAGTSGADTITGDAGNDVLLGQGDHDAVDAGTEADYAEGGQGSDLVRGGDGDDDVVGGSFAISSSTSVGGVGQPDAGDDVEGGSGSDLLLGDNGLLTRPTDGQRDWRTDRANATQTGLVPARGMTHHDLVGPVPSSAAPLRSAGDALSGGTGVDVIFGQDGDDRVSGGGDDDYAEGDGGADVLHGDAALTLSELVTAPADAAWSTPLVDGATVTAGQDDLIGGWARQGYRDGADTVHGDGGDDFVVGDNGNVARVLDGTTERIYTQRYGSARPGVAKVRVAGDNASSTRFCPTTGSTATATCEVTGAYGGDTVLGDDGDDVLYGQDGGDTIWAGDGDDDVYGELGSGRPLRRGRRGRHPR